jgi:hypothetical protein
MPRSSHVKLEVVVPSNFNFGIVILLAYKLTASYHHKGRTKVYLGAPGKTRRNRANSSPEKIDYSGGGLIKSAFAGFLERATNGRIWGILKFRHFGPFWGELGPLMTPFWGEFGHFGVIFSRLGDQVVSATKEYGGEVQVRFPLEPCRLCFTTKFDLA